MQRHGFRYMVESRVSFTGRELLVLFLTARLHYDGKCRAAAEPIRPGATFGGELWGILNRFCYEDTTPDGLEPTLRCMPHQETEPSENMFVRVCTEHPDDTVEVVLDNDVLSRLGKIAELTVGTPETQRLLAKLNRDLLDAVRQAGEEWKRVNPPTDATGEVQDVPSPS